MITFIIHYNINHQSNSSSIKWYKTLSPRAKVLKSNSYTNKQTQNNYKMIKNTATKNKITKK